MSRDLDWRRDGPAWPNHEASRFVRAAGLDWHVQEAGAGPVLLLAHGTGASTHSWRDLLPELARHFRVVAPDLPGHGFTTRPPMWRMSLAGMAADLTALIDALPVRPDVVIGHSAGAAILCRAVLDGGMAPRGIVSLNGALLAFRGLAGHVFSPLAKVLAGNPVAAHIAARLATRRSVERLLVDTGSELDPRGVDLYWRLVQSPAHVGAALGMMANWDLERFERDLAGLTVPLLLVVGGSDRAIPPESAEKVRRIVRAVRIEAMRGLGHLAHEEQPGRNATVIADFASELGLL